MPYVDIPLARGDRIYLVGSAVLFDPATGVETPIDLTVGGTTIRMTIRRYKNDATPLAQFSGGSGITVNSPASAGLNRFTVNADQPVAMTNLTSAAYLPFDVEVVEAGGRRTTQVEGTIKLRLDVS